MKSEDFLLVEIHKKGLGFSTYRGEKFSVKVLAQF